MCGRFALYATPEELIREFSLKQKINIPPRYNIAPTQQVAIIRDVPGNGRQFTMVRWGLIPPWSKDEKGGALLINARGETLAEKPSFRDAFARRRCLIPARGFYEWTKSGKIKQPYFISMKNGGLFAMAGIWETWTDSGGKTIESVSIITTTANGIVGKIHERMPVILSKEVYGLWLAAHFRDGNSFAEILKPYSPYKIKTHPVSLMVNNVKNEGPACCARQEYLFGD